MFSPVTQGFRSGVISLRPTSRVRAGPLARATVGTCLAALSLAACGGTTHLLQTRAARADSAAAPPSNPCQAEARAAVARSLDVSPSTIAQSRSTGNNGMPQCGFTARLAAGKRVQVLANVDDGPQAYFRLERTAEEASQPFTPSRLSPPPTPVSGLGLGADWFPQYPQLMATDGIRLITVAVTWPGAAQSRAEGLAEAVARTYLRTPHGKAAEALIQGYPEGG